MRSTKIEFQARTYNESEGTYTDQPETVRLQTGDFGLIADLSTPSLEQDVYLERIPGAWRLNATRGGEVILQVALPDDDDIYLM